MKIAILVELGLPLHKVPMLTFYRLYKEVTQTVEAINPSTLFQGLPSAVIGKQDIVKEQKNVIFSTILTHTQPNNI